MAFRSGGRLLGWLVGWMNGLLSSRRMCALIYFLDGGLAGCSAQAIFSGLTEPVAMLTDSYTKKRSLSGRPACIRQFAWTTGTTAR